MTILTTGFEYDEYEDDDTPTKKIKLKLPNRPSELILVALEDLKKAERSKKFTIDMDKWYEPEGDGTCAVCFAGSVMAIKHNGPKRLMPDYFDDESRSKFEFLNSIREYDSGNSAIEFADARNWGWERQERFETVLREIIDDLPTNHEGWFEHAQYEDNPSKFKRNMKTIANELAKKGF